jgi:hypothetical protein
MCESDSAAELSASPVHDHPAFIMVACRARKNAVLALRGTHSLSDTMIDAQAVVRPSLERNRPMPYVACFIPAICTCACPCRCMYTCPPPCTTHHVQEQLLVVGELHGYAHSGMLTAAHWCERVLFGPIPSPTRPTSHRIAAQRVAPRRTASSHRVAPRRTASHRVAPRRTAPRHIASRRRSHHVVVRFGTFPCAGSWMSYVRHCYSSTPKVTSHPEHFISSQSGFDRPRPLSYCTTSSQASPSR